MPRELRSSLLGFWDQLTGKQRPISPPWDEDWKLDEDFFRGLADWDNLHQESTFLKLVEKIKDTMITRKPFLGLIPEAPFPAYSLVLALSHLLELGVTIAQAKGEVFKFVDEVSSWVVTIEANFKDGKFSSRARKNLKHMQALLNEIFKWAWSRLNDGRWEKLLHGMSIVDEIQDFNQRLSNARGMLRTMQDINVTVDIDDILWQIKEIKKLQESQIEILDRLESERRQFLYRSLHRFALQDTGYNHQGKAPCDPETRVEILATIKDWVHDLSEGSKTFFWLTGDPGSGKSAIAASFARDCKDRSILWAQFFINRNNEPTTYPRSYFPSIVRQMADHTADLTVTVVTHEILRNKESLLDEMSLGQGLEFFVKVVQTACDLDRSQPVAIIFDGLDETSRNHLADTARIFSGLFTKLDRPNAKVFISSRTDDEITRPFYGSLQTDSKYVQHLHLDTSGSRKDVGIYLRRNLEYLVEKWALDWEQWPGEERFQRLCDQAGGLFIWAVTAVKFFREQFEKYGLERRNRILGTLNEIGMRNVDNVYRIILEMALESDNDDWEYEKFRCIVGFIIALKEPLTIGDLSGLLDLRKSSDSDPVDIIHFVTNLRTVLVAGVEHVGNDTIPRLHKSFVEYITSNRADQFRIDIPVVDRQIGIKCLQLAGRLRNAGEIDKPPAGSVRYAVHNWTRHLPGERISQSDSRPRLRRPDKENQEKIEMVNCWIAAEHALRHIQKSRPQIDAAFSKRNIQESEYALFAGFDESLIQDGISYLEQIHIFTSVVIVPDPPFLAQLGKILSPFSSILFSKSSHPHRLPVFKPDGIIWDFDEFVFETASKLADRGSTAASYPTVISLSQSSGGATSGGRGSQESSGADKERNTSDDTDKKEDDSDGDSEGEERKGNKKGKDREENPQGPEEPDDEPEEQSEPKLVRFDVSSDLHLNDHSGRFQLLTVAGDLTIQFEKHARAAECHVQFTKLNFGSVRTTPGTAYEQFFLRVTVDPRNQDANVNILKPLQTYANDKGSKVVSASKSGWIATGSAAATVSLLKPQATFTATGGGTGETSISTENMQYNSQIDPQTYFGIASCGFNIDDPSHRTRGIQMPHAILPAIDFEFLAMASDPIHVPSIIDVEIKSYWTAISHSEYGFPWISGVFSPLKKTVSPYSNLCQAVLLEIPSRLVRRADYKAGRLVNIKDLNLGYFTNVRFVDGPVGFSVTPAISRSSPSDSTSVEMADWTSASKFPTLKY